LPNQLFYFLNKAARGQKNKKIRHRKNPDAGCHENIRNEKPGSYLSFFSKGSK
jgi:hypothetical protein